MPDTIAHGGRRKRKGTVFHLDADGRKIVHNINHDLNGYKNYGCRCTKCTAAQATYQAVWRAENASQQVPA